METTPKAMESTKAYNDFTERLKILIGKHPTLITTTLSNIFTMRLIGNKTHGDLAEIAISEFINQYMYDFQSTHVGKDLFRAKSQEEDIKITNEITKVEFFVSLKAYGDGPLQLSTDKTFSMFPLLENEEKDDKEEIVDEEQIRNLLSNPVFSNFGEINVLPLIYDEKLKRCNILVFDYDRAHKSISRIVRERKSHRRTHPVYKFYDSENNYICEVRYGDATSNALQRGLWTHTKRGRKFFDSITKDWIDYSHNQLLISLFSCALVSSKAGHEAALEKIRKDILNLKQNSGMV